MALLLLALPLGLPSCRSLTAPSGRHDLSGQFDGAFNDDVVANVLSTLWTWKLTQVRDSVFGTVIATQPGGGLFSGNLAGRLDGDYLYFTVDVPANGIVSPAVGPSTCTMTLTGSATVSKMTGPSPKTVMTGTYSGTRSCGSAISDGTFVNTRPDGPS